MNLRRFAALCLSLACGRSVGPPQSTAARDGGGPSRAPLTSGCSVALSSPAPGALLGVHSVQMRGTATAPACAVTCAGASAAVAADGAFSAAVALAEGSNRLVCQTADGASTEVDVEADWTAPVLTLTRPSASPAKVSESPYLLQGTVADAHLDSVLVQGQRVDVVGGAFSALVPLALDDSDVPVVARDAAGNQTTVVQHFTTVDVPPAIRVLSPVWGSEAVGSTVEVTVQVTSLAPLARVSIGTADASEASAGIFRATVPLSLGDNSIPITATDLRGLWSSATLRVHHSDASAEALVVAGVEPAAGAIGVEPDALVSITFNKPIVPETLSAGFFLGADGTRIAGGYSVSPSHQTVSFVARAPLPLGRRLRVSVSGVSPEVGAGLAHDFVSEFTTRAALTRVRGLISDDRFRPLQGVRVVAEGSSLETVTGADGNWTLFGLGSGQVTMRFEGGSTQGRALPSIRRGLFVDAGGDVQDGMLLLTPLDPLATARVDGGQRVHAAFGGSDVLWLETGANVLRFPGGQLSGTLTATRIASYARPLPFDGALKPAFLWQLSPAGVRLSDESMVSMPNLSGAPAGRRAVIFTHDPARNLLQPAALGRISADGRAVVPDNPLHANSLELFGFTALTEQQSAAVDAALSGAQPAPGKQGWLDFRPLLQNPFAIRDAFAQFFLLNMDAARQSYEAELAPGLVYGNVHAPVEVRTVLQLRSPDLASTAPVVIAPPVRLPLQIAVAYDRGGVPLGNDPAPILHLSIASGPPENEPVTLPELTPPAAGTIQSATPVNVPLDLPLGRTRVTISAWQTAPAAPNARISPRQMVFDVVVDPTGKLTFTKLLDQATTTALYVASSPFQGTRVEIPDLGASSVGPAGNYAIPFLASGVPTPTTGPIPPSNGAMGIAFAQIPFGPHPVRLATGRVEMVPTDFLARSPAFGYAPGSEIRADVLVDARAFFGHVALVDAHGKPIAPICSGAKTIRAADGTVSSISAADMASTEVHFFRESDPNDALAKYSFTAPTDYGSSCPGATWQHGSYMRLRLGPSDYLKTVYREECRQREAQGGSAITDDFYRAECSKDVGVARNFARIAAGDRLLVFAINHATGYAGMKTVVVPPVSAAPANCTPDAGASDGGLDDCAMQQLGIQADLSLYPPEIEVRVERAGNEDGRRISSHAAKHLVRNTGSATTTDEYVRVETRWRVRTQPLPDAADGGADAGDGGADAGDDCGLTLSDGGYLYGIRPDGGYCGLSVIRDSADAGAYVEKPCTDPSAPKDNCLSDWTALVDVPAGVPPLAGRIWSATATALGEPMPVVFDISPGPHTALLHPQLRVAGPDGGIADLVNLPTAAYYLHAVGHSVAVQDTNGDGIIEQSEEYPTDPAATPDFSEDGGTDGGGVPTAALSLKDVYRGYDRDGTLYERYDRTREHQFRVIKIGGPSTDGGPLVVATTAADAGTNALPDAGSDGGTDGGPDAGRVLSGDPNAAAQESDVSYQMTLALLEPIERTHQQNDWRYEVRLGTDAQGIDCKLAVVPSTSGNGAESLSIDCGGDSFYDAISAGDIIYLELFQSGNAENALYRLNMAGIVNRHDLLSAGSAITAQQEEVPDSVNSGTRMPAPRRPLSRRAEAHFWVRPDELQSGYVQICRVRPVAPAGCPSGQLIDEMQLTWNGASEYSLQPRPGNPNPTEIDLNWYQYPNQGPNGSKTFAVILPTDVGLSGSYDDDGRRAGDQAAPPQPPAPIYAWIVPDRQDGFERRVGIPRGRNEAQTAESVAQTEVAGVNLSDGHLTLATEDLWVAEGGGSLTFRRTYNNQNNVLRPTGLGWFDNFDAEVVEEEAGRYSVNIEGQTIPFPWCFDHGPNRTVSATTSGPVTCQTDPLHGDELKVNVTTSAAGPPQFSFAYRKSGSAMRYIFNTPSSGPTREGRRIVLLSALDDGTGAQYLTYRPNTDRLISVSRQTNDNAVLKRAWSLSEAPAHAQITFEYDGERIPARNVDAEFQRRSFRLLKSVSIGIVGGATIDSIKLQHDWTLDGAGSCDNGTALDMQVMVGNLSCAKHQVQGSPGAQSAEWTYRYQNPSGNLGALELRNRRNEVEEVRLLVEGVEQQHWSYRRSGTQAPQPHQPAYEAITEIYEPSRADVDASSFGKPRCEVDHPVQPCWIVEPIRIQYTPVRTVLIPSPGGTITWTYQLNDHGSVKMVKRNGQVVRSADWNNDASVAKKVWPTHANVPGASDVRSQFDQTLMQLQSQDIAADGGRTTHVAVTAFDDSDAGVRGAPVQVATTMDTGTRTWSRPLDVKAHRPTQELIDDPASQTKAIGYEVTYTDGGVPLSGVTSGGATVAFDQLNVMGLPEHVTLTKPATPSGLNGGAGAGPVLLTLTHDSIGRVTRRENSWSGQVESWSYDVLGRLVTHKVSGKVNDPATDPGQRTDIRYLAQERNAYVEEVWLNGVKRSQKTYVSGKLVREQHAFRGEADPATVQQWTGNDSGADAGLPWNSSASVDAGWAFASFTYADGGALASSHEETAPGVNGGIVIEKKWSYDTAGRPVSLNLADGGAEWSVTYDVADRVNNRTDQNGLTTHFDYDEFGRLVRRSWSDGGEAETLDRDPENGAVRKWTLTEPDGGAHLLSFAPDAIGAAAAAKAGDAGTAYHTEAVLDSSGRIGLLATSNDDNGGLEEKTATADPLSRVTERIRTVRGLSAPDGGLAATTLDETRDYSVAGRVTIKQTFTGLSDPAAAPVRQRTIVYDSGGRAIRMEWTVDGHPAVATQRYDERGQVVEYDSPIAGASYTRKYDLAGRLIEVDEPATGTADSGSITRFEYDGAGHLLEKYGPRANEHWSFRYDPFGRPVSRTLDADAATAQPRMTWTWDYGPSAVVTETESVDPNGPPPIDSRKIRRTYDARGRLVQETWLDGSTPAFQVNRQYDGEQVALEEQVEGTWKRTLTRRFDDRRRPTNVLDTWSGRYGLQYTYQTASCYFDDSLTMRIVEAPRTGDPGPQCNLLSGNDVVTSVLGRNGAGDVVWRSVANALESSEFDALGELVRQTATGLYPRKYQYEESGLLKRSIFDDGTASPETTTVGYQLDGLPIQVATPDNRTRTFEYTLRGLVKTESFGAPGGLTDQRSFVYGDGGDQPTAMTASDATWRYTRWPRGDLGKVDLPGTLGSLSYQYDAAGRIRTISSSDLFDLATNQRFDYDYKGRLSQRFRGGTLRKWSSPWSDGEQTETDPANALTTTLYDGRGRPVHVTYGPSPSGSPSAITRTFNAHDQEATVSEDYAPDAFSTMAFNRFVTTTYDALWRPLSRSVTGGETVSWTYAADPLDLPIRVTSSASSRSVDSPHDSFGRISAIAGNAVRWEPGGQRLLSILGGGLSEQRCYDDRGWLMTVRNMPGSTALPACPVSNTPDATVGALPVAGSAFYYAYDARGNRTREYHFDSAGSQTITYTPDLADRLKAWSADDGSSQSSWTYDLTTAGVRKGERKKTGNTWTRDLTYQQDGAGFLNGAVDNLSGQTSTLQLDFAGRVQQLHLPASAGVPAVDRTLQWNSAGRLVQVTNGGQSVSYRYDSRGLRMVAGSSPVDATTYVWGRDDLLEEGRGSSWLTYARAGGITVAVNDQRYARDALGTIVGRMASGSLQVSRLDPWGNYSVNAPAPGDPSAAYAGQAWDASAGLSYAQQRWYAPSLGRFLSEDPAGASPNRLQSGRELDGFGYASANPTRWLDPDGRAVDWWRVTKGFAGGVARKAVNGFFFLGGGVSKMAGGVEGYVDADWNVNYKNQAQLQADTDAAYRLANRSGEVLAKGPAVTLATVIEYQADAIGKPLDRASNACGDAAQSVFGAKPSQDCGEAAADATTASLALLPAAKSLTGLEGGAANITANLPNSTGRALSVVGGGPLPTAGSAVAAGGGFGGPLGWLGGMAMSQGDPGGNASPAKGSGPGRWRARNESMPERARKYQEQVTGAERGQVYEVNGRNFDGYRDGVLLDAKAEGYASFIDKDGRFKKWFDVQRELLDPAQKQLSAAQGTKIRWHVAEKSFADALTELFENRGINIDVVHTPPIP